MKSEAEAERDYGERRGTKLTTDASANEKKKRRKPLADLTNFKNPSSIIPKPCNPNSNSLNPPRNLSNSSIGSSNYNTTTHKKNAQFSSSIPGHGSVEGSKLLVAGSEGKDIGLQPRNYRQKIAGDDVRALNSDSVALNMLQMEKTKDRGKTIVDLNLDKAKDKGKAPDAAFKVSSAERTRDKGKAIAGHFNNHALVKTQDRGKGISVSSDSISVESVKDKATESNSIPSLPSLAKTRDKGKAVVRPGDSSTAGKRKEKEKGVSLHFSCPPVPKTRHIRNALNEPGDNGQTEFHTDPRLKHKKKRRCLPRDQDTPEYNLPADFIEKQRAYYKEVDEFELLEEEVSDNEDETKGRDHSKSVI